MSTFLHGEAKVLVFVDEPSVAEHLARALEGRVCLFADPRESPLQRVYDEVPHLVVLDEDFNSGRGRDVANSIKEDIVLRHIPVMLLTRGEESRASKDSTRIDCFLRKNHPSALIVDLVNDLLERNADELDLNPLTRLPGSRSSLVRIERAVRAKERLAILCVDVPDFYAYNAAYGPSRGDEVVSRAAKIIREKTAYCPHADAFVGHLGSDDFLVVVHSDEAARLCEEIIRAFDSFVPGFHPNADRARGYWLAPAADGRQEPRAFLTLSIAIVHNDSVPLRSSAEVSRIAGELKRYMKELPHSGYIHYGRPASEADAPPPRLEVRFPTSGTSAPVNAGGGTDRTAAFFQKILKEKKIRTVFQPIVDLKTMRIAGFEALTRAVSDYPINEATLLFAVARETNRVKELDRLCLEFALKNAQKLPPGLKLSLNLNVETLLDAQTAKDIGSFKGKLSYEDLVIEVTEQSLLRSFDKVRDALEVLRAVGAAVAIDDVGGGAVSLRDVAILKPDYIKFDRSLIRQIDASTAKQQIVMSLNVFAAGIGAKTTAEGIETADELEAARMCGADLGQGFYLARPGEAFPGLSI